MLHRRMPFLPHPSDTGGTGDDAGQGADTTQASDKATPPTGDTPDTGDTGADSGADTPKTFSEEEFNQRMRGQGKELKTAQTRIAAFEKAEQARTAAEEVKQREEMSELDKLRADLEAERALTAQAAAERDGLLEKGRAAQAAALAAEGLAKYGPRSQRVAELLPPAAKEVEDGKLTEAAVTASVQFVRDNPTLFRDAGAGTTETAVTGTTGTETPTGDGYYAQIRRRNAGGQS